VIIAAVEAAAADRQTFCVCFSYHYHYHNQDLHLALSLRLHTQGRGRDEDVVCLSDVKMKKESIERMRQGDSPMKARGERLRRKTH
jgi:hypothetical protein